MVGGVVVGVVLTAALVITLLCSCFIVFIILTSKQYKNSTSLLHLQLMTAGILLSLLFIIFSTPSLIQGRWVTAGGSENDSDSPATDNSSEAEEISASTPEELNGTSVADVLSGMETGGVWCQIQGFLLLLLHTAGVWVVVGLHCDKYCAIATPLRYTQLVTRPRVAAFSCLAWLLGLGIATPPLAGPYTYTPHQGVCLPACHTSNAAGYVWALAAVCVGLPLVIMVAINIRIVLIARHHQHRIFSAIFEVMMSAQATVTHQKNPFDLPRKKRKSVWGVLEQVVTFLFCCCPWFLTAVWEAVQGHQAHPYWSLMATTSLLLAPLANVVVYGAKSRGVRQALRNYLRKKLYKTEMRHEIQARVPSAANSRRPSITSTLALPLTRSLQRRMSDCLLPNLARPSSPDKPRMHRRSSDLSWHPLEEGTPSPTRLRRPMDAIIPMNSPVGSHSPASVSNFLTVPTFEAARGYCASVTAPHRVTLSTSSLDSDGSITGRDDDITLMLSPSPDPGIDSPPEYRDGPEIGMIKSRSLELGSRRSCSGPGAGDRADCQTPLLVAAFQRPTRSSSLNSSSPYVLRALEAILSVRISQSLLRRGSGWGGSRGSLERLAAFLRETRSNHAYSPCLPVPRPPSPPPPPSSPCQSKPQDNQLNVVTFLPPLANGTCLAVPQDAPRETSLTVP